MFGFPTWLTGFLIFYALLIAGVWILSFSNILFDEEADYKAAEHKTEQEKETGGEV